MEENREKLTRPDWSKMLTEILEQIWKRLTIPHQAVVSTVCKPWHLSTSNKSNIWSLEFPWIIMNDRTSLQYKLFNITLQRNFYVAKPLTSSNNTFVIGSCKGWLAIRSNDDELFILNLFSKLRIDLPSWFRKPAGFSILNPLVFTISMCAKLNPIVVAGITFDRNLIWCSIGDQEWKECRSNEKYTNVTFHNGKLYAINQNCDKIDIFQVDNDEQKLILLDTIRVTIPTVSRSRSKRFDVYLVESKGSLLVVKRYYGYGALIDPTIGFDIFKVQERISDNSPLMLVNVESLENQALFFSGLFYESLSAKDCLGLQGDRIYFIGNHIGNCTYEFGVFSPDEGIIFREPIPHYPINPPIWLLPRYVFECNCKCHPSTLWRPAN